MADHFLKPTFHTFSGSNIFRIDSIWKIGQCSIFGHKICFRIKLLIVGGSLEKAAFPEMMLAKVAVSFEVKRVRIIRENSLFHLVREHAVPIGSGSDSRVRGS